MATNELDDCIQIQFEFLWQTQEQKDIFGTSKQGTIHLRRRQIFTIFDPSPPIGIPAKCL